MNINDNHSSPVTLSLSQVTGAQSQATGAKSPDSSNTALGTEQPGSFYDSNAWWNNPDMSRQEIAKRSLEWSKSNHDREYPWSLPPEIQALAPAARPGYLSGHPRKRPSYLFGKADNSLPLCLVCNELCYVRNRRSDCCNSQIVDDVGFLFELPRAGSFHVRAPRVVSHKSGYKHVAYCAAANGWTAKIKIARLLLYNGVFDRDIDAAQAADDLLFALWQARVLQDVEKVKTRMNFVSAYFGPLKVPASERCIVPRTAANVQKALEHIEKNGLDSLTEKSMEKFYENKND